MLANLLFSLFLPFYLLTVELGPHHLTPPRSPELSGIYRREFKENKEPSPKVKRKRSVKISNVALEPVQWQNDSLQIITSASDLKSMDEFLLKKVTPVLTAPDKSSESSKSRWRQQSQNCPGGSSNNTNNLSKGAQAHTRAGLGEKMGTLCMHRAIVLHGHSSFGASVALSCPRWHQKWVTLEGRS